MPNSVIRIRVKTFRPIGSLTTTTVEMDLHASKEVAPDTRVYRDGFITKIGSCNLRSKRQLDASNNPIPLHLKFWVVGDPTDADREEMMRLRGKPDGYLIHGIAFSNRNQTVDEEKLGEHVFTKIAITNENLGDASGGKEVRVMTVTNSGGHTANESYDYLILIQRIHDGAFGIIDPEYENEL